MMSLARDFISLVYPRTCRACKALLYKHEDLLCNLCYTTLPRSDFHLDHHNAMAAVFHGRVPLNATGSYYLFEKKGRVQRLLHDIKYNRNKKLAFQTGQWYGESLKAQSSFAEADLIVPVPLHIKKQKQRGFNQSEEFAKGISETLGIPLSTGNLVRHIYTATQTRRRRFDRWENVKDVFRVNDPSLLKDKTIILVDDVVTTGATIEASCQALLQVPGVRLSVLSLAFAKNN